jgi:hypothetical protein
MWSAFGKPPLFHDQSSLYLSLNLKGGQRIVHLPRILGYCPEKTHAISLL